MLNREEMDPTLVALLRGALVSPEWEELEGDKDFLQAEQRMEQHIWQLEQSSMLWQQRFHHEGHFRGLIQDNPKLYDLFRLAWASNGLCQRYLNLLYYRQGEKDSLRRQKKTSAP